MEILKEVEDDGKGNVDFPVFGDIMARKMKVGEAHEEEEEIMSIMKALDAGGGGKIPKEDLKLIVSRLGEEVTDEEFDMMMRGMEVDEDGKVDYEKFVLAGMSKTPLTQEEIKDYLNVFRKS